MVNMCFIAVVDNKDPGKTAHVQSKQSIYHSQFHQPLSTTKHAQDYFKNTSIVEYL